MSLEIPPAAHSVILCHSLEETVDAYTQALTGALPWRWGSASKGQLKSL